ncbi:MAG TPA: cytochrome P450, partial [Acidimicrobiales bacterium]|nr:cytochrome P450 [Acidimicrobiales bacterium]
FADVFAAARDTERFSSAQGLTFTYDDMAFAGLEAARPIVMMDPPQHTEFRRRVASAFTPRSVARLEPVVRSFVQERLADLVAAGGGDVAAALFKPLPSMIVAHYLGVPAADRGRFDEWTEAIVAASAAGDPMGAPGAVSELFGYFSSLIDYRRRSGDVGDDTISTLVRSGASTVDTLGILGFAFTMVTGGNDTTTGLLGGAAGLLTTHRDQRSQLIADPTLIPAAVEELLRLTSPVQGLARTTTCDVVLDGGTVPAGRKVMLLFASANRDERRFGPDAAELDIRRDPKPILSFGYGAHHCLGAAVARLQARVALEELLARCPDFAVDEEAASFAPGHFVRRYLHLPFTP